MASWRRQVWTPLNLIFDQDNLSLMICGLTRDPEICRKALDRVSQVLKPEPAKTTLGELVR